MAQTFNSGAIFGALQQDGHAGAYSLANSLADKAIDLVDETWENAVRVKVPLTGREKQAFERWSREPEIIFHKTVDSCKHNLEAACRTRVVEIAAKKIYSRSDVLVVGTTFDEAVALTKLCPEVYFTFLIGICDGADMERFAKGMDRANAIRAKGGGAPKDILALSFTCLKPEVGSKHGRFEVVSGIRDWPNLNFRMILAIDSVLTVHPSDLCHFMNLNKIPRILFSMHHAAEVFMGPALGEKLQSALFDYSWVKQSTVTNKKTYTLTMSFEDSSKDYCEDPAVCYAWWMQTYYRNLHWAGVYGCSGYGLFEGFVASDNFTFVSKRMYMYDNAIRAFEPLPLFKFGKLNTFFVDKDKYSSLRDYLIQTTTSKQEPFNFGGFMLKARSLLRRVVLVGNPISEDWSLMGKELQSICLYCIMDVSLTNLSVREMFRETSKLIRRGGRLQGDGLLEWTWFLNMLGNWWNNVFKGRDMQDFIKAYADYRITAAIDDSFIRKMIWNVEDVIEYITKESFVGGDFEDEGEESRLLKQYKSEVLHYDAGVTVESANHATLKISGFIHSLASRHVLHFGATPGGMVQQLLKVCGLVTVALPKDAIYPQIVEDTLVWKSQPVELYAANAKFFKPEPRLKFLIANFKDLDLSPYTSLVFDVSCCNGSGCASPCLRPLMWLKYYCHLAGELNIPVVAKVNTPDLKGFMSILEDNWALNFEFLRPSRANPMSFETYVKIQKKSALTLFLPLMAKANHSGCIQRQFADYYAPILKKWSDFKAWKHLGLHESAVLAPKVAAPVSPVAVAPLAAAKAPIFSKDPDVGVAKHVGKEASLDKAKSSEDVKDTTRDSTDLLCTDNNLDFSGKGDLVDFQGASGSESVKIGIPMTPSDLGSSMEYLPNPVEQRMRQLEDTIAKCGVANASLDEQAQHCLALRELTVEVARWPGRKRRTPSKIDYQEYWQLAEYTFPEADGLPRSANLPECKVAPIGHFIAAEKAIAPEPEVGEKEPSCCDKCASEEPLSKHGKKYYCAYCLSHEKLGLKESDSLCATCGEPCLGTFCLACEPTLDEDKELKLKVKSKKDKMVKLYGIEEFGLEKVKTLLSKDQNFASEVDEYHYCPIVPDGRCVARAMHTIATGYQDGWEETYKYIAKNYFDLLIDQPGVTKVKAMFRQIGVPFVHITGKDFSLPGSSNHFGFVLLFENHADVAIQQPCLSPRFVVHPQVRIPDAVDPDKFEFVKVDFSQVTKMTGGDARKKLIISLDCSEKARFFAIHQAAQDHLKTTKSLASPKAKETSVFFFNGGPGCNKTETCLTIAKSFKGEDMRKKVLYIAQSGDGRVEFIDRYCQKWFKDNATTDPKRIGVFVKTWAAVFAPNKKECYQPGSGIKLIIIDECFRHAAFYCQMLAHAFPSAKMLFVGDEQQLSVDSKHYWEPTVNMAGQKLTTLKEAYSLMKLPNNVGHTEVVVSRRFGPLAVILAKKAKPDAKLFCDNVREFDVGVINPDTLDDMPTDEGRLTMVASNDPYEQKYIEERGYSTICASQGRSVDEAFIILDKMTITALTKYSDTAYVAVTRAKSRLTFVIYDQKSYDTAKPLVKRFNLPPSKCVKSQKEKTVGGESDLLKAEVRGVSRLILQRVAKDLNTVYHAPTWIKSPDYKVGYGTQGGAVRISLEEQLGEGAPLRFEDVDVRKFLRPVKADMGKFGNIVDPDFMREMTHTDRVINPIPTLKAFHPFKREKPIAPGITFTKGELDALVQLPEGNIKEHMISDGLVKGDMVLNSDNHDTVHKDALLINETMYGKRHYTRSARHTINAFTHRIGSAALANRKHKHLFKHMEPKFCAQAWFNFYIDKEKFSAIMNSNIYLHLEQESLNEFTEVMKLNKPQADTTMRAFLFSLSAHAKQQIKARDLDAVASAKVAQPILAMEKALNACYSLMFRTLAKVITLTLRDKFLVPIGMTDEEVARWIASRSDNLLEIFMCDMPEFDSTQTNKTIDVQYEVWLLVLESAIGRMGFFKGLLAGMVIFCAYFKAFYTWWRGSGFPDTLIDNVINQMWQWALAVLFSVRDEEFNKENVAKWFAKGFALIEKLFRMSSDGIAYMIFFGDDMGAGLTRGWKSVFNMKFMSSIYLKPLKVVVHPKVLEFCNNLYGHGTYCYNPMSLLKKMVNKNYAEVMRTAGKWAEFQDSLSVVVNQYRKDFHQCVALTSEWHNFGPEYAEALLIACDGYACLTYKRAIETLCPSFFGLEDFIGGHLEYEPNQSENMSTTVNYEERLNRDGKSKINEDSQITKEMPTYTFLQVSGSTGMPPTFTCVIHYLGKSATLRGAPTKKQAEQAAATVWIDNFGPLRSDPNGGTMQNDLNYANYQKKLLEAEVTKLKKDLIQSKHLLADKQRSLSLSESARMESQNQLADLSSENASLQRKVKANEETINWARSELLEQAAMYRALEDKKGVSPAIVSELDELRSRPVLDLGAVARHSMNLLLDGVKMASIVDGQSVWAKIADEFENWSVGVDDYEEKYGKTMRQRNKEMHALNGNSSAAPKAQRPKRTPRSERKKEAKTEVKVVVEKPKTKTQRKRSNGGAIQRVQNAINVNASREPGVLKTAFKHGFEAVAAAIMMPEDYPAFRFNDAYANEATGLIPSATQVKDLDIMPSANTAILPLPNLTGYGVVFRDYMRAAIVYVANKANEPWGYYLQFTDPSNYNSQSPFPNTHQYINCDTTYKMIPFQCGVVGNDTFSNPWKFQPHGAVYYAHFQDDKNWIWLDEGVVQYSYDVTPSGGDTWTIGIDQWTPSGIAVDAIGPIIVASVTPSGSNITIPAPGYYSFRIKSSGASTGGAHNFAFQFKSDAYCFAHLSAPGLFKHIGGLSNVRTEGVCLRFKNSAPAEFKCGDGAGVQYGPGTFWYDTVALEYSSFAESQNRVNIDYNQGMIIVPKLLADTDMQMQVRHATFQGKYVATRNPIVPTTCYTVGRFVVYNDSAAGGKIFLSYNGEKIDDDPWDEAMMPTLSPNAVSGGIAMTKKMPHTYHNATHVKDFFRKIVRGAEQVVNGITKYGPLALDVAGMFV